MRTLGEIIELTRDGGKPEYEELRYALCALDALGAFDRRAFIRLANKKTNGEWEWNESFRRTKEALGKSPKDWVGWNNDPDNPEFLQRRSVAKRLVDKLSAQPAPCQHGKTQMRENVGYDIDEEGEEDQHLEVCLDCGAERFHCDHTKHGRTAGTWFGGNAAQPAPEKEKPAARCTCTDASGDVLTQLPCPVHGSEKKGCGNANL